MKASQVHESLAKHLPVGSEPIVVDLENSQGPYLRDALTGKDYIDFFTYFASAPIGHNHPKMHDSNFVEKLLAVALTKPSSSDFYTVQMAEFVETFARIAMPKGMEHLFLISGGALAVENALKVAFDWKVRKNFERIAKQGGKAGMQPVDGLGSKIIHFREAFHGRSGYTMSLTNTDDVRKYMYFPKFNWPRVLNPKLRFPVDDNVLADVERAESIAIAQIESAVRQFPGDIAGLIIEPIQGEGGDNHFRPEFFKELRRLADEHEFLLIADEIQSGMGITGKMWAIEHMGVEADIIVFGKKAQVCGLIAGPRIDEVEGHVFAEESRINSTFGGDLTDMTRSTRFLEIIQEDDLVAHTAQMGEKMLAGLRSLAETSKGVVSNVRGRGMMIAFDLPDKVQRDATIDRMKQNGVYALKSGERSIRFRGMLDLPEEIIEKSLAVVEKSLPAA
ncbi:MAG: L-lysine 6-transaminase [Chloroflexi bacterium]|nr:L-lysine 6-transaminase [Chloroflexota bacterium]MQC25980.1 L-lysine 6-transaminase [Chloroflexota bacterium]